MWASSNVRSSSWPAHGERVEAGGSSQDCLQYENPESRGHGFLKCRYYAELKRDKL